MTGGIAYVMDQTGEFAAVCCNRTDVTSSRRQSQRMSRHCIE